MKITPHQWVEKFGCSSAHIDVLLDGVVQKYCTEADDEAGYVIRWSGASPQPDEETWRTERLEGKVEFRRKVAAE